MVDDLQFYPTPQWLAELLWSKFTDTNFVRVIDTSAGDGALPDAAPRDYYDRAPKIDCIELDASKHPILREKRYRVVGLDFLNFEGGHCYSHVIMNPPFAEGAKHMLKAWDMLYEGEISAVINAQTLRNPFSAERKRLVKLIADHGDVEFIQDAFKGEEVVREADVEVAVVHLIKPAECSEDWIGPVIEAMAVDRNQEQSFELPRELALPDSFVTNQVRAFRVAVKSMREAVRMRAVADHYAVRIGRTMDDLANHRGESDAPEVVSVRKAMEEGYDQLKDRAWASVLRSTETLSRLSSKVQKQAESQFEAIKALEFSESNVFGFLLGLVQSQPEMQMDMLCEVFDTITRYWSDNTVFYRGWKSNDKHRSMGMRVKMTRFIIPHMRCSSWSMDWDCIRQLADFDKAFAILDGRREPEVSLVSLFDPSKGGQDRDSFTKLKRGERLDSSYLSVRFYKGVGTVHMYPRSKELIDRLNRIVGRRRGWLPPADQEAGEAFWKQFDCAEKFDAEFREEALRKAKGTRLHFHRSDHPINQFMLRDENHARAEATLASAMEVVLERHGLLEAITHEAVSQPLLLEMA